MGTPLETLLYLTLSFTIYSRCHASCSSNSWVEQNGACYLLLPSVMSHPDAELTCADEGGHIASIKDTDLAIYVKSLFSNSNAISTLWSRYLVLKFGSDIIVTDKVNNVTTCGGCNSLKSTVTNEGLTCIAISGITQGSSNWILEDCDANHQVVCQKAAVLDSVLEVKDIAAISCLAFLIVSFVIVITIDLIKNPVPEDNRHLIEENR